MYLDFDIVPLLDEQFPLWEEVNTNAFSSTFLTSWHWINFQKSINKKIDTFLVYLNNQPVGNLYLEIFKRKISKYAYLPYGPVLDISKIKEISKEVNNAEIYEKFYKKLKLFADEYCRLNPLNLFRIDPPVDKKFFFEIERSGWKKSNALGQAKHTWIMELPKSDKELLQMQPKETRYYIKRGKKIGIQVKEAMQEKDLFAFIELTRQTKIRQKFENFHDSYYVAQWKHLGPKAMKDPLTRIWIAYYEDKPVSAALINYYKDTVNYSHGASTSDVALSKIASPYFLHYSIAAKAIQEGFKNYNFWGVIPKGINHPWRGVADFKMKFKGKMVSYLGTYETSSNFLKFKLNRLYDNYIYRKERY